MGQIPADMAWGILALVVVQLVTWGIMVFQHRLMWNDYKIRHKMNGDKESAGISPEAQ